MTLFNYLAGLGIDFMRNGSRGITKGTVFSAALAASWYLHRNCARFNMLFGWCTEMLEAADT